MKGYFTLQLYLLLFGDIVSWRTKRQSHVALSSAEAEFVSMSLACRELTNLMEMSRRILNLNLEAIVFEDNKAAIELAKTEESKPLKHIVNLCYHYVRGEVQSGRIKLQWIGTQNQLGDFFTKPLTRPKFCEFRNRIMSNPDTD